MLFYLFLFSAPVAAKSFTVALIEDGPEIRTNELRRHLVAELNELTSEEFDVNYKIYEGAWSLEGIKSAFLQGFNDPQVDLVLATGVAANQIGLSFKSYKKPTFLPYIIDQRLFGAPRSGLVSGKNNLNYLANRILLSSDIARLQQVKPFDSLAFFVANQLLEIIPEQAQQEVNEATGISVQFIGHDGETELLTDKLPTEVGAVIIAALPQLDEAEFQALIDWFNEKKIPSFSLIGPRDVERGMLATVAPEQDWIRLARRNALNMQAVMIGENASQQPIDFEAKRKITINMETARKIGHSPPFDVLSESVLLNQDPQDSGPVYTLVTVSQRALQANLSLLADSYDVGISQRQVTTARGQLLPQLSLQATNLYRKDDSPAVSAGQLAEESSDGSISLSQLLYSDDAWANMRIQQHRAKGSQASYQQQQLDTVQAAANAFVNVLSARSELRIQAENLNLTNTNLELARDRVRVGSSTASDQFRWESQLATDRANLIRSRAVYDQARESLNRLLNRPLTERFQMQIPEVTDAFAISQQEYEVLVDNPARYERLTEWGVDFGVARAPEVVALQAQLQAKTREISNLRRDFWLPDFSLSGQYNKNYAQVGGAQVNEDLGDWNVALSATLPLSAGGARRAELSRAILEEKQLRVRLGAAKEQIEQRIRGGFHSILASYENLELSELAAEAARKNLALITDSYSEGLVSVIELLDAQNARVAAELRAANAIFDFVSDGVDLQRAYGGYDFLMTEDEKMNRAADIRAFLDAEE